MHNWTKLVEDCLSTTEYMCLATHGSGGIWPSPVYFAWDKDFNFYFTSLVSSRHLRNISEDYNVGLAIFSTDQDENGDVTGLQVSGTATILTSEDEIAPAFETYFARSCALPNVKYGDKVNSPYAYSKDWIFVKVAPHEIWLFDSKNFGDHRQAVPLSDIIAQQ